VRDLKKCCTLYNKEGGENMKYYDWLQDYEPSDYYDPRTDCPACEGSGLCPGDMGQCEHCNGTGDLDDVVDYSD